jgi:ubiquinone/menaquinone biosynthesis C-methylase UbiE
MGTGIEHTIRKINWPCTVVMTDLSHRILVWTRKYFSEEVRNPFVDIVYLACDCAFLPVCDSAIDLVTSLAGFESMQNKMLDGFQEACRVLKHGATLASVMALIESRRDEQSSKWMKLMDEACRADGFENPIRDYAEWQRICAETGYRHTEITRIYDDLPAPEVDTFPFENNILQWVGMHITESSK